MIHIPFVVDPVTEKPSVSLSILVLATIVVIIAFALDISGVVEGTSIALEFFGISSALYFSRRIGISGKTFTSDTSNSTEEDKKV